MDIILFLVILSPKKQFTVYLIRNAEFPKIIV